MWRSRIEGARQAKNAPGGYLEVRYEELHDDGPATLQRAYAACGLDVAIDECAATLQQFAFDKMAAAGTVATSILTGGEFSGDERTRVEPDGFFRKGVVGGWRDEWGFPERHDFDAAAGAMLVELGYERDHGWVGSGRARSHWKEASARRTAKMLRRAASRIERRATPEKED